MHAIIDGRRHHKATDLTFSRLVYSKGLEGSTVEIDLYVDIAQDEFDPTGYDRIYGLGTANKAIQELRKALGSASSLIKFRWESKV